MVFMEDIVGSGVVEWWWWGEKERGSEEVEVLVSFGGRVGGGIDF